MTMLNKTIARSPFRLLPGLFLAVAFCNRADKPRALKWDLSGDTQLTRVGWPKDRNPEVWYVDGPGTIWIKARGGFEKEVPYWFAQVWRVNASVRTICIMLPPGPAERVYGDAMKLADE